MNKNEIFYHETWILEGTFFTIHIQTPWNIYGEHNLNEPLDHFEYNEQEIVNGSGGVNCW